MSVLRIICTLRCCALKSGRPVQSSVCAMAARSDFQQGVLLMCVIARLSCFHILPHSWTVGASWLVHRMKLRGP